MKKIKKTQKFDSCGGRTHNLGFPSSMLYHLHHHNPLLNVNSFILKVNHAQKHTTSKCWESDGNHGPLDFQIFIRVKANIKEGNAQLCMYTEIQSGAQLLKQRQNMHDSNVAQNQHIHWKIWGSETDRVDLTQICTYIQFTTSGR